MSYNLRAGSSIRGSRTAGMLRDTESVDPMSSVANIADAILVMSVGLMIAIVTFWNVDMSNIQEVIASDEVTEVNVEEMADEMQNQGGGYNELGTVYQDPTTGKLYMLTQDVDKGASHVNSGSADTLGGSSSEDGSK